MTELCAPHTPRARRAAPRHAADAAARRAPLAARRSRRRVAPAARPQSLTLSTLTLARHPNPICRFVFLEMGGRREAIALLLLPLPEPARERRRSSLRFRRESRRSSASAGAATRRVSVLRRSSNAVSPGLQTRTHGPGDTPATLHAQCEGLPTGSNAGASAPAGGEGTRAEGARDGCAAAGSRPTQPAPHAVVRPLLSGASGRGAAVQPVVAARPSARSDAPSPRASATEPPQPLPTAQAAAQPQAAAEARVLAEWRGAIGQFDVREARAHERADEASLLTTIEAGFGSYDTFNRAVRAALLEVMANGAAGTADAEACRSGSPVASAEQRARALLSGESGWRKSASSLAHVPRCMSVVTTASGASSPARRSHPPPAYRWRQSTDAPTARTTDDR